MKTTRLIASLLSVLILLTFTSAVLAEGEAAATPAATPAATATPAGTATPAATPAATAAPATTPAATAPAGTATPALVPAGTAAPAAAGGNAPTAKEIADAVVKKEKEVVEEEPQEETFFQKYFMFIMLGGFVLLWMFMSRGRKKREAKRREMLSELTKGDKVVTIGGICGTIIETTETEITLKVGENNRMKMARWAIRMAGQEAQDDKKNDSQTDAR